MYLKEEFKKEICDFFSLDIDQFKFVGISNLSYGIPFLEFNDGNNTIGIIDRNGDFMALRISIKANGRKLMIANGKKLIFYYYGGITTYEKRNGFSPKKDINKIDGKAFDFTTELVTIKLIKGK